MTRIIDGPGQSSKNNQDPYVIVQDIFALVY